jgi:hypothetical protein
MVLGQIYEELGDKDKAKVYRDRANRLLNPSQ